MIFIIYFYEIDLICVIFKFLLNAMLNNLLSKHYIKRGR